MQENIWRNGYNISEPPADLDAEQALLGNLLMKPEGFTEVQGILSAEHFADDAHRAVFEAAQEIISNFGRLSIQHLTRVLEKHPSFEEFGGVQYIGELYANALTIVDPMHMARLVRDLHDRRCLIQITEDAAALAWQSDYDGTTRQMVENLEAELFQLTQDASNGRGFQQIGSVIRETLHTIEAAYANEGQLVGVTTGINALDRRLGGLRKPDLVVLAARPSMGKTALAMNIAKATAKAGHKVAIFSLEMSAEQIMLRMISDETGIPISALTSGNLHPGQFEYLNQCERHMARLPIQINDRAGISPAYLRTEARRTARKMGGLDLIVVDYLQLMSADNSKANSNRVNDISSITAALKGVAKELDVPVILLSQLSRECERREDKRPQLSDLRDSGSIEQDADVVMFVYRDEYYLERLEPPIHDRTKWDAWANAMEAAKGKAEIITAKFRQGAVGRDVLAFEGAFTRFSDLQGEQA